MSGRSSEQQRSKPRKVTGKRCSDGFLGFVDINLTDRDREELEAFNAPGAVDLEAFMLAVIEDGYKLSVVADPEHNSVIATMTGRHQHCPNKGYALSARGPNAHGALVALWYKQDTIAHWGLWADEADAVPDGQLPLWS